MNSEGIGSTAVMIVAMLKNKMIMLLFENVTKLEKLTEVGDMVNFGNFYLGMNAWILILYLLKW